MLLKLNLPSEDYAVFGSGPMSAHGLKPLRDIDLIARRKAWEKVKTLGKVEKAKTYEGEVVHINDKIEVYNFWGPGEWDMDELIDSAEVIDGVRFVNLEDVVKWKQMRGKPKDKQHLKLIEQYLKTK